ncbi:hypothetical protein, partial [Klebsiella sp. JB_Kp019]|uniref:hypothetical protein n=1 Tax=Klebsiella sp. JB_Kp019 TaxID=3153371 RepID=UPI0032B5AB63
CRPAQAQRRRAIPEDGLMASPPGKAFWLMTNLFHYCARISAGWRLSPYPAYERRQYQPVMLLAVRPRKRSAAGQSLKTV